MKRRSSSKGRKVAYSRSNRGKIVKGYTRTTGLYGRFGPGSKRPESKFFDVLMTSYTITAVPVVVPNYTNTEGAGTAITTLLSIPQSALPTARVGRKIFLKSIQGHLSIRAVPITSGGGASFDIWLIQDTQTNGVQCTASEIWNVTGGGPNGPQQFLNLSNEGRFKVLFKKTVHMKFDAYYNAALLANGDTREIDFVVLPKCSMEWDQSVTTGAISSCRSNSFHIFVCGVDNLGAAPAANLTGMLRARFTDA